MTRAGLSDMWPRLLLLLAIALAAGCGDSDATSTSTVERSPIATPLPPTAHVPESPVGAPPAWVATEAGSRWLGLSTHCWSGEGSGGCADYAAPDCKDPQHTPHLAVRTGEQVTFHLACTPQRLKLTETTGDDSAVPAGAPVDCRRAGTSSGRCRRTCASSR